jgi:CDP-glucose 4,6-dehydratase
MAPSFWAGKRVFITGHTGFKGGWLSLWLAARGAEVHGYSLPPVTSPNLFDQAAIRERIAGHILADIRDLGALSSAMARAKPDIVFHMAAQPLVRQSYSEPVETYAVNVMGTANVLEAARRLGSVSALVNVTTDKCYENKEWVWGYRENEPLGGHDPYSSSKACSELVAAAYRASFHGSGRPWIATGRAGNVIGGGDWAEDRLLPDIFRALAEGKTMTVRYPGAIRPWQHVLEPLSGYVALAEQLVGDGRAFASAWNFGPDDKDAKPVGWILEEVRAQCPELRWEVESAPTLHEANFLKLDSSKARAALGWRPRWSLATALEKSIEWHRAYRSGNDPAETCLEQIADYEAARADD